ncbi:tudor domain-containing protein 1 isoform X3 [Sarcophilus harrisii]|uniref:tudor domain-containing protein 1 isoform X3 n=1 Tax=Sarcophilus harrisii TaxID=9305 RepID=UPI001301B38A|nr:tudor domain-containing protein 1 isoform X3 [Sarcophilus harrisii]
MEPGICDFQLQFDKMSRNNSDISACKVTEQLNIERNEIKPPHEPLRSPRSYPNFKLKSPEHGSKTVGIAKKNFLFCEQTKRYFASCENSSPPSNSNCINKEAVGSKIDKKTSTGNSVATLNIGNNLPTKELNTKLSTHLSPAKPKMLQNLSENPLSLNYDSKLFNSLIPSPRSTTCHRCGLYGSLRCSQCKQTYYCCVACQRRDWSAHSIVCKPIKQNFPKPDDTKLSCETKKMEVNKEDDYQLGITTEIIGSTKKIMFSDLQNLQLRKTMEIKGTVTEFKHPGEFYIQICSSEVLEYIRKLSTSLKESYMNMMPQEEYIPIKGEICVAKYSVDQTWNRVIVQDVDVQQKKAQVLYIDYGNGEVIPISRIQQLNKNIELFPPCAIKCFVANVIPAEGSWNNDCTNAIKPLLVEQYCSLKILDILQEEIISFAVDVLLPGSGKHLDHVLLEMGYGLRPKGQNSKMQSSDKSDFEDSGEKTSKDKTTTECKSNLIPKVLSLNVGDEFCGVVAHIQTPEDFFCQQLQSGRQLAELQLSLSEYCNKMSTQSDFYPAIGDICCAQFSEDNQWYRASVLAYASEESALVGYVDYGNFEILKLNRLCPMAPRLLELPMQAIKCILAGVKPSSGIWSPEAICLMKKLIRNKMITVKVVDKKENSSVVELIDKSIKPSISVSKILIEAGFAVGEGKILTTDTSNELREINAPLTVEETVNTFEWTWVELAVNETVNVMVCMLYNPGEFYCHILKEDALSGLNEVNRSLAEYCQQKMPNEFKPEIGEPCCAYFTGDGNWYRALVKEILPNATVKVHFVDYGNIEEVTVDKLRKMSSKFLKLPFQGIRCWLVDIKPRNKHWSKEATARFQMCVAGIKLKAKIVDLTDNGAGVELTDPSTAYPKIISDILIDEHLVLKDEPPCKDTQNSKPVDLPFDPDVLQATSSDQWKTIEFPVDEIVPACILEIISPSLFYALPIESRADQEKLNLMTVKLTDHCNSQKNRALFKPRIGDVCCARFTSDNYWYRAIILKVSESEVKVLYADYGNIETLPFSRIQPITTIYLELPFQIIRCSFEGIMELEGGWSPLVLEQLKKLMLNQNVMISVKGIIKNVHAVSVEKRSENGTINIADKLVMEGLAKHIATKNQSVLNKGQTNCCCTELRKQVEKHEQILLFLLNNPTNQDKFTEMKKLLKS